MAEPKHTERMKAMARESALRHYACSCPPNECAMSDDGGPNPVDASLCGRVAAEALADV